MKMPPQDPVERAIPLCGVALAIAQARPQALQDALARCQAHSALSSRDVEEAILQGIPYSGFPGAVEALGLWHDLPDSPPLSHRFPKSISPTLSNTYRSSYPAGPTTGPYTGGESARGERNL